MFTEGVDIVSEKSVKEAKYKDKQIVLTLSDGSQVSPVYSLLLLTFKTHFVWLLCTNSFSQILFLRMLSPHSNLILRFSYLLYAVYACSLTIILLIHLLLKMRSRSSVFVFLQFFVVLGKTWKRILLASSSILPDFMGKQYK